MRLFSFAALELVRKGREGVGDEKGEEDGDNLGYGDVAEDGDGVGDEKGEEDEDNMGDGDGEERWRGRWR